MDIPFSDSGLANSEKKWLAGPALIQSTQIHLSPTQIPLLQLPHPTVPWPLLLQPKVSIRPGNTEQDFQCGMSVPNCATSEDLPTSQKAPPRRRCLCKMETAQAGMSCYL